MALYSGCHMGDTGRHDLREAVGISGDNGKPMERETSWRNVVTYPSLTKACKRRPIAYAPMSLRLFGAPDAQR